MDTFFVCTPYILYGCVVGKSARGELLPVGGSGRRVSRKETNKKTPRILRCEIPRAGCCYYYNIIVIDTVTDETFMSWASLLRGRSLVKDIPTRPTDDETRRTRFDTTTATCVII